MPYYHVIASLKSRPQKDALAIDLSEKELTDKILKPKLEGRKFVCNLSEELVDPDDIKSIRITKTDKRIPMVTGGSFIPTYTQYWEAANSGEDVTEDFIPKTEAKVTATGKGLSENIFIVHGRDHKPMKELKAMLKEFGLNPVVLHEQPSGSRTIIEKLEKYSDVGYAFVILTPDDLGTSDEQFNKYNQNFVEELAKFRNGKQTEDETKKRLAENADNFIENRARQNVVLEFGYFIGKLNRDRVCCLLKGDVERPSDMHGIVYIHFKESIIEVRDKIVKELKAAGYGIKI